MRNKVFSAGLSFLQHMRAQLRRLAGDRRGISGVEFALLAPLLIGIYVTSVELTIGLGVSARASRSADSIADLMARSTSISQSMLTESTELAQQLFAPHSSAGIEIKISGIKLDSAANATIAWSWKNDGSAPYSTGSSVSIPDGMSIKDGFLVRAEVAIDHGLLMFLPGFINSGQQTITIARQAFYATRMGNSITCSCAVGS